MNKPAIVGELRYLPSSPVQDAFSKDICFASKASIACSESQIPDKHRKREGDGYQPASTAAAWQS